MKTQESRSDQVLTHMEEAHRGVSAGALQRKFWPNPRGDNARQVLLGLERLGLVRKTDRHGKSVKGNPPPRLWERTDKPRTTWQIEHTIQEGSRLEKIVQLLELSEVPMTTSELAAKVSGGLDRVRETLRRAEERGLLRRVRVSGEGHVTRYGFSWVFAWVLAESEHQGDFEPCEHCGGTGVIRSLE